jgi:aspartyl-tRNA(Asn)/glutamyl-tRNA(Gln) amidotransferase subunit C
MIEKEKIKGIADFSKLQFSDEELVTFGKEFENIIAFVKQIQSAKCGTEERYDKILEIEELREDIVKPSMPIEDVLLNAPRKSGRYFAVPKVVE